MVSTARGSRRTTSGRASLTSKEYPVTGDPNSDTRSYKRIDDRTLEFTGKKDGKVTVTGRVVVAGDGKTRTVTAKAADAKGTMISTTTFYDKQ